MYLNPEQAVKLCENYCTSKDDFISLIKIAYLLRDAKDETFARNVVRKMDVRFNKPNCDTFIIGHGFCSCISWFGHLYFITIDGELLLFELSTEQVDKTLALLEGKTETEKGDENANVQES